MSNNNEQKGNIALVIVLAVALTLALTGLSKRLADAKVKNIQKTIEQQFTESEE